MSTLPSQLAQDGCAWIRGALTPEDRTRLARAFAADRPGQRIARPSDLISGTALDDILRAHLPGYFPVRVVTFEKSRAANWGLPWHQDRVIAVSEKSEVSGFHNWTRKSGVWHCEPPAETLENMIFLRIHLDATDAQNGAMEFARGSHREGVVPSDMASDVAARYPIEIEEAEAGDILALSMLTLHRSRPSTSPAKRRVIRIDLANQPLPPPLSWSD